MYVHNFRYQVKTPSGWKDFSGIKSSLRDDVVKLKTTTSETITTPEHKVKLSNGDIKVVRDLICDDELSEDIKVCDVTLSHKQTTVYDLINVDEVHEYCTNGFVSKNCAFIRDFEDIYTGLYPTISAGGSAILISTPNGVGGMYYKLWTDAVLGLNNFKTINLPWHVHPEHNQKWFDSETKGLGKQKIAQEFLCIGAGARVITPEGYSFIENLQIGDTVMTAKGRFMPVTNVRSRLVAEDEKVYSVNSPVNRKNTVVMTGEHPIQSYRLWANGESTFSALERNFDLKPIWLNVEKYFEKRKTTDRILGVLSPQLSSDCIRNELRQIDLSTLIDSIDVTNETCRYHKQCGKTKRYVSVDYDLGKFIGLYLAEGCSKRNGIDLGFHIDELNTHAEWCSNFIQSLGGRVTVLPDKTYNSCRLWTYNQHIAALVKFFIDGKYAHEKTLNMDRVLSTNPEFIKGLLIGHYLGDGNHAHVKKFSVFSTSSKLIYQLRTLNSHFGLLPRIGHIDHNSKNSLHHDTWYLEFQALDKTYEDLLKSGQLVKSQSRIRRFDSKFVGALRVNDVTELASRDGGLTVYDIEVAEDHSFVVESIVVHNCDFISSGDTFLQPEEMDYLRSMIDTPIKKEGPAHGVWIWADPKPGKKYVISSDVARGDGSDFSTFHIIDYENCEVVAEYMGKIPPDKLADLLLTYGTIYNTALLCPERNTFGYFTCVKLRDAKYKRLYHREATGDVYDYVSNDLEAVPGFETQANTRPQILTKLEELIRNKILKIHSQRFYDQMQAFIWSGSKAQASRDAHDDLIIGLAIGTWLTNGVKNTSEQGSDIAIAMLKAISVSRRDQSEMPGNANSVQPLINPAIRGVNPYNVHKPNNSENIRIGNVNDYRWLLK